MYIFFMSLLLLVELNKNTLPLRHSRHKLFHTHFFNKKNLETLFWSKTECETICVSNAEVGECFFLIPPTKAETWKQCCFTKTLRSDLPNLFPFLFFFFVVSQYWAYDFLEKGVQKEFEVNLYLCLIFVFVVSVRRR